MFELHNLFVFARHSIVKKFIRIILSLFFHQLYYRVVSIFSLPLHKIHKECRISNNNNTPQWDANNVISRARFHESSQFRTLKRKILFEIYEPKKEVNGQIIHLWQFYFLLWERKKLWVDYELSFAKFLSLVECLWYSLEFNFYLDIWVSFDLDFMLTNI